MLYTEAFKAVWASDESRWRLFLETDAVEERAYLKRVMATQMADAARWDDLLAVPIAVQMAQVREERCAWALASHAGFTPLHSAVHAGDTASVAAILAADPDTARVKDDFQKLPLHVAAAQGHLGIVQLLLAAAPDAARSFGSGFRSSHCHLPLHIAAAGGHMEVVQALLVAAPYTVFFGHQGTGATALELALRQGHVDVACQLLHAGAPVPRLALEALRRAGQAAWPLLEQLPTMLDNAAVQGVLQVPTMLDNPRWQGVKLQEARLQQEDVLRVRTAVLCLARVQRRVGQQLPVPVLHKVLGLSLALP